MEAQFCLIREREGRQKREAMAFVQGDGDGEVCEGQVVADEPDSDGSSDSSVELRMHKANKITKKKLKKLKKKQKAAAFSDVQEELTSTMGRMARPSSGDTQNDNVRPVAK
ncbi:hypothetical protein Tco_1517965 [Tanacetum coccineum]